MKYVYFRVELSKRLPWLAIKETAPSDTQSTATENTVATTPAQ